jgi:hypothetical protein
MVKKVFQPVRMFQEQDLPLFSGVAPRAEVRPFEETENAQPRLFEMPVSWDKLAARKDKIIKRRK